MKPLFIISSAIRTKHGKFSATERLQQTIETLKSIRDRIPDAKILVNESSGEQSITQEENNKLSRYADWIENYSSDPQVQEIYKSTNNWDIVKNYTEMLVTAKSLYILETYSPESSRIFKLSGRYQLTNDFDLNKYDDPNLTSKYIFSARRNSQFPTNVTNGLTHQLMSRLWSWPTNKSDLVLARYKIMLEDFTNSLNQNNYRDIEHLLFKYFEGPNLFEFPIIGVTGQLGPTARQVSD